MSGSVPCRFFARGMCKFGDNCRFSHGSQTQRSGGFGGGVDPNLQAQLNATTQNLDKNKEFFVDCMSKDMEEWELGNIWPFSSYGPIGGKKSIPYFEDMSQEEMRFQTLQNGGLPTQEIIQRHVQWAKIRAFIIQNRSAAKNLIVIDQVMNNVPSPSAITQPAVTRNIFAQQQPPAAAPAPQYQNQSPSIFGGSSSPQGFANTSGSYFIATTPPSQPSVPTLASTFASPFGQPFHQPQISQTAGMDSTEMLGTPTINQHFAFNSAPAPNVSPWGQQQQLSSATPIPAAGFGLQGFTNAPSLPTQPQTAGTGFFNSSTFGSGSALSQTSQTINPSPTDKFTYSQLSDLKPEDISEYEAVNFTSCESIPLKPPTKDMCFRN